MTSEEKRLRLTMLMRLVASPAWCETAKKQSGDIQGETRYDTVRRQIEQLERELG